MKKFFKKTLVWTMIATLVLPTVPLKPLSVKADTELGGKVINAEAEASADINVGRHSNIHIEVNTNANSVLVNGSDVEVSAYLIESVQGKQRGTYVPDLDRFLNSEFAYEYDYSALREMRFFNQQNKRDNIFKQDGTFDLEYVEALNWLYKNNYVHNFESLYISQKHTSYDLGKKSIVFSASGNGNESVKEVVLEPGFYYIEYNMYNTKDKLQMYNSNGYTVVDTGDFEGSGSKDFYVNAKGKYKIVVNRGGNKGNESTWDYAIYNKHDNNYAIKHINDITLKELTGKNSFLYPINSDGINRTIKKKDFIMQLMKVVDGVEESRPLLIESQYEMTDLKGKTSPLTGIQSVLQTPFKDEIGKTGLDIGVNNVSVDFDKYGMHKYYVNPNVYELYLEKAYNSGIISINEISNVAFKKTLEYEQTYDNSRAQREKLNSRIPRWDNSLPPIRINTTRKIDNNGDYNVDNNTPVFGGSWTDITKADSSVKVTGEVKYNPDYEYFTKPRVSYIEAVVYAYKAINAYADEKLPQREVDTIMSMYSVNYGRLTESEKEALNYLIAKGIIDGDTSAKWTSTENITVKDAIVMMYRIANPSARLTFKQVYEPIDQAMLERGYGQSKTTIKSFSSELPVMDIQSEEKDDYYIIMNDTLSKNNYILGTEKFSELIIEGMEVETKKYTSKELANLGLIIKDGTYTVRKYSIPWNAEISRLGLTPRSKDNKVPDWINIEIGGGFYFIDEDLLDDKTEELKFTHVYTNVSSNFSGVIDLDDLNNDDNYYEYDDGGFVEDNETYNNNSRNKDNGVNDDNDPLDILSYGNRPFSHTSLTEIILPKYLDDGKDKKDDTIEIYMGINEKAKAYLLLDGQPLFKNGKLNKDLISQLDDIKNIVEVQGVPTKSNGSTMSDKNVKTFIKFIYPKTGERSVEEIKSLIKRRLTLSAEGEIANEDIASYTSTTNGATMISQKELKRFGIKSSKEEPDILYHERTDTYAYLNTEKDYALISNTVMKFPENSMMIEITADDIYYNVEVVMALINDSDFYVFNNEGKYEIVRTLTNLQLKEIINPSTNVTMDKTYTADVYKYTDVNKKTQQQKVGKFINISTISGEPATFFISTDKITNKKRIIYGFEPYYIRSLNSSNGTAKKADDIVNDLTIQTSNMIRIENILINNAILRQEFLIPKSETFVYTDNAIKVTHLTRSGSYEYYAEQYLDFIERLYQNISENDVRSDANNLTDSNPYYSNKNFRLTDLLDRKLFVNGESNDVKKLLAEVRKGRDVDAFWVLYFLDKFTVNLADAPNMNYEQEQEYFKKKLLEKFNKKYSFKASGVKIDTTAKLSLLRTTTSSETDIRHKRVYNFKQMVAAPNEGMISTDNTIFVNRNEAIYMKLTDFTSTSYNSKDSLTIGLNGTVTLGLRKYLAGSNNLDITYTQRKSLQYQQNVLGTTFYIKNSKLLSPTVEYYVTLPEGQKPLELHSNGTKFKLTNSNGVSEEFIIVNNMVLVGDEVAVKIARVKTRPVSQYNIPAANDAERLYSYYSNTTNYANSVKSLGKFSVAVNTNVSSYEHVIKSSELQSVIYTKGTQNNFVYFDTDNKKADTVYNFLTDVGNGKNNSKFMQAYVRDKNTFSLTTNVASSNAKLMFNEGASVNFNDISKNNSDISLPKSLYGNNGNVKQEFMVYDSYLVNYGTISLSQDKVANLNIRSDYVLNSSAVLTDIVDVLIKAIKKDRINVDTKTVGDLVNGDKLILKGGTLNSLSLTVLKTSNSKKNGYSHFISVAPVDNTITAKELEYSGSVLLKNYALMDGIKVTTAKERKPLYNYVGNRELNLASSEDLKRYAKNLTFPTLSTSNGVLVEEVSGNSVKTKKFTFEYNATSTQMKNGKVSDLSSNEMNLAFPYYLSIYLDSNLLVKKNSQGYYEIVGYANDNLINTKAFTSRADRFKGVFDSLLTVLPTFSPVEGKFLGFDLSKLAVDNLARLLTLEYWTDLIKYIILNAEQVLSAIGIYYVYLLMVLVILGYAMPDTMYRWVFNPVKLMTFGRLDISDINLPKFLTECIITISLLTLVYAGFLRILILKAEEIRVTIADYFIYPFL